jgi:hypothetical protein
MPSRFHRHRKSRGLCLLRGLLPMQQGLRWLAAGLLALTLAACVSQPLAGVPLVANPLLDELSGLAVSHADPTFLWAHNDSGDGPNLFRVGFAGEDLGRVTIEGAKAVDWEDIATFDWQGQPAVLIGDIGDNNARHAQSTLYVVTDPGRSGVPKLLWTLKFRYPDGPRDCESLAVDPVDHVILLLSKRDFPPRLYALPMPAEATDVPELSTATFLGPVETIPEPTLGDLTQPLYLGILSSLPTAMDISRDGAFAVVTTYGDAYLYRRQPGQPWIQVFAQKPVRIPLPHLKQTEAGAISADGRSLFVSTEQRPTPLVRVPLPP